MNTEQTQPMTHSFDKYELLKGKIPKSLQNVEPLAATAASRASLKAGSGKTSFPTF